MGVKVVIDLIEGLREEIANQGDFTLLAMLLKENSLGDMELAGEKKISRVGVVDQQLIFYVDVKERTVFVEPIVKMLEEFSGEEMMMEVKISVSGTLFDIIGFGNSKEDKKFVCFLTL